MRINPKYNNICASQISAYRKDPCYDCSHIEECDQHYDEVTGEWDYPNPLAPRPKARRYKGDSKESGLSNKERGALTRIRSGEYDPASGKFDSILKKELEIAHSITKLIDKDNGVYSDDLMKETGFTREYITRYLKRIGFEKTNGPSSKRWEKKFV